MTDQNPEHQRERFLAYMANVEAAQKVVQEVTLPNFWEHPCPCMKPDEDGVLDRNIESIQVVEPGYWRWESVDTIEEAEATPTPGVKVERTFHAHTDGWDSMSECGFVEYIECTEVNGGCGAIWAVPKELDWD